MLSTSLMFDMRAPDFGSPISRLYASALEMIAYADTKGIDQIILPEHHCSEDGYNPVPALMGAAAAARTERINIVLGAIVLPLHDPVKVAETIAVADLISAGRTHVVLAAGYSQGEFKAFRKSLRDRAKLMDQGLEIIVRALSGERFMDGDREVFVRPLPLSEPPKVYVGGGVAASARRAARFGLGFWGMNDEANQMYVEECRKLGREPGPMMQQSIGIHVAEDPERAWSQIGDHVLHLVRSYAAWSGDASESSSPLHGLNDLEAVRKAGIIQVVTPDQCVELAKQRSIALMPLVSGLDPDIGWGSLELFVDKALPRIQASR